MLEELWALSDKNKKRILIIATIIVMVIVVSIWLSYLNNLVAQPVGQAPALEQATSSTYSASATVPVAASVPAQANGPSLWQNIEHMFGGMIDIFRGPSHYNIQPKSN